MKRSDKDRYNELVEQIKRNNNLEEPERIEFYDLHLKVVIKNNDVVRKLIKENRCREKKNDKYYIFENERKYIFKVLNQIREHQRLDRYEYNYLTFVAWRYELPLSVDKPCIPQILKINLSKFRDKFSINAKRVDLYTLFLDGLKMCLDKYQLEKAEFLIGGSYVDIGNDNPKDIDFAIILPTNVFHSDLNQRIISSINKKFQIKTTGKNQIDLMKLPECCNDDLYMAYEVITLLGVVTT